MSMDIIVFCKDLSADLIPKIISRLRDFNMNVEAHPDFKFDQETDKGFLPFKYSFIKSPYQSLVGKELISGFEIYISDYEYEREEPVNPKPTFLQRLFRIKPKPIYANGPEIEEKLIECGPPHENRELDKLLSC